MPGLAHGGRRDQPLGISFSFHCWAQIIRQMLLPLSHLSVCLLLVFFPIQGFFVQPWLSWNSPYRPAWPPAQRSACLSAGTKGGASTPSSTESSCFDLSPNGVQWSVLASWPVSVFSLPSQGRQSFSSVHSWLTVLSECSFWRRDSKGRYSEPKFQTLESYLFRDVRKLSLFLQ